MEETREEGRRGGRGRRNMINVPEEKHRSEGYLTHLPFLLIVAVDPQLRRNIV